MKDIIIKRLDFLKKENQKVPSDNISSKIRELQLVLDAHEEELQNATPVCDCGQCQRAKGEI